jgi:hypothetical protein
MRIAHWVTKAININSEYVIIIGFFPTVTMVTLTRLYVTLYRVIRKSLCTWRLQYKKKIPIKLMIWRWPSQNTFGMWTVLYWTRSSRTRFGVSINVCRMAGENFNIICNFLYCNHQATDTIRSPCIFPLYSQHPQQNLDTSYCRQHILGLSVNINKSVNWSPYKLTILHTCTGLYKLLWNGLMMAVMAGTGSH